MKMPSRGCRLLFVLLFPAFLTGFYHFPWIASFHQKYFPPQNSSNCACDTCVRDGDPWSSKLLEKSPYPFVSNTSNISASTFNYWRAFQFDRRSFAYYQNTVDKVLRMFPHIPQVAKPSPDRCLTCAVVGNSGNLNGSHYGPLIDFHDLVIRINRGPTKGFEQDVGNKTTHHIMYPVSATNLDNNTHLVLFPFKIGDFEWLMRTFTPSKGKRQSLTANKDLVMILNPAFMEYVHKEWLTKKGRYPSTGFMTVVLSLLMCDEVSVFGFGADRNGNWNHYYEILKVKNLKTGQHPGGHEYTLLNKLFFNRKIRFFRAW